MKFEQKLLNNIKIWRETEMERWRNSNIEHEVKITEYDKLISICEKEIKANSQKGSE